MADKIAEFAQLDSGVHPSLPNSRIPLWVDGRNVVYKEASVQPSPGHFVLADKLEIAPVMGAIEVRIDGVPTLFWGTQKHLYYFTKGAALVHPVTRTAAGPVQTLYTGIRNQTATEHATIWSFASWGRWVLATNGKDPPQIWKPEAADIWPASPDGVAEFKLWSEGGDDVSVLGGDITTAEIVRTNGPFALLFNFGGTSGIGKESEFRWAHIDDVELFTAAAANASGALPMRDLSSPIIAAEDLGGGIGVYGTDQLHLVEFIGAPLYYGTRHLLSGVGAAGKNSVVVAGHMHYGLGPRGIFRTDGTKVQYIDDPSIHDFVYNQVNRSQLSKALAWYEATQDIVFFSVPTGVSLDNSVTVGYNVRNGTWGIYDFFRTTATAGSIFDFPLSFDVQGTPYQQAIEGVGFTLGAEQSPLTLVANTILTSKYGHLGYGEGGYGGTFNLGDG